MARTAGRPRQFDHDQALDGALRLFWRNGLTGTSVDQLAAAMRINKPSLYNAFGGKEAVYRLALHTFVDRMEQEVGTALDHPDINVALTAFFEQALRVYFEATPALGCFAMCTAALDAGNNDDIRDDLQKVIRQLDLRLKKRFALAQRQGQVAHGQNALHLARLSQSVLHGLALRARAGEPRTTLQQFAKQSVRLICAAA